MDLLQNIRIVTIPKGLRAVITVMLVSLFAFNIYVGAEGLMNDQKAGWAEAASNLLGVILPIIILAMLFAFSHAGIQALRDKTNEVLLKVLPEYLALIKDREADFFVVRDDQGHRPATPLDWPAQDKAAVRSNLKDGCCYCDYEIRIPEENGKTRLIYVRLELNVRKVNFNLYLNVDRIREAFNVADTTTPTELSSLVMSKFGHAAEGAGGVGVAEPSNDYIVYRTNKTLHPRKLNGRDYLCLVATANLKPDFLWDPSERLYFAQDILFMVRAYYEEYPDFFTVVEA